MSKKKWHDWNNLLNQAGPHTAPSMVNRSANNHSTDSPPQGAFLRGRKYDIGHPRTRLGDLQEGHTHKHLKMGFRKEKVY